MKKIFGVLLAFVMGAGITLTGCGDAKPADLTGNWKDNDSDMEMTATISGEDIRVYWNADDAKALYWAGTFVAPTVAGDYSWESQNYTEETQYALLASSDTSKTFAYSDGELKFEVSIMGITSTISMCKDADSTELSIQENSEEAQSELDQEEQKKQAATENSNDYKVEIEDFGVALNYITSDKSEVGLSVYMYMKNPTEDKVFTDVKYQYTIMRESDSTVIDTTDLYCSYIAPGETAIAVGELTMSIDDLEDVGDDRRNFVSGDIKNVNSIEIVPQSSFEVTGINATEGSLWMEFKGQVTNNSSIDVPTGASIILVAKKEGEVQAVVQGYLDKITAGNTVSFVLSGTDDMDGDYDDYDVYIDYMVW